MEKGLRTPYSEVLGIIGTSIYLTHETFLTSLLISGDWALESGLSTTGPDITPCRSNYYKSCKKCDTNVKEYRNAGLLQNKSTRVAKYLIPVIIVSVLLNIPKFLETSVAYDEETGEVIIFTFYTLSY